MNPPSSPAQPASTVTPESPWLGLRSFSEGTREYFFGRTAELEDLFQRVRQRPLTVLFGQSGLGKTSLLAAGLVPRLRDAGWLPVSLRLRYDTGAPSPAAQMFDGLTQALRDAGQLPLAVRLSERMNAAPLESDFLWLLFHDPALGFLDPSQPRPAFLFDQFEEVFTLGELKDASRVAAHVRDTLACLIENRPPPGVRARLEQDDELAERLDYSAEPARFVLSLREDFLHRLERWRRQMPVLMDNRLELRLLTGPQALAAAVEPGRRRPTPAPPILTEEAGAAVVRFVAGVAADVPLAEIDAVPPLLSLLCAELNERRLAAGHAQIDVEALAGSAEDILVGFYDRTLAAHPPRVRWFIEDRLLSEGGYRQPVNEDSVLSKLTRALAGRDDPAAAARAVLDSLIDSRLLTIEERGGMRRVELTHDVLTRVAHRSRADRRERLSALAAEEARKEREAREDAKLSLTQQAERRLRRSVVIALLIAAAFVIIVGFFWASVISAEKQEKELRTNLKDVRLLLANSDEEAAYTALQAGDEARAFAHLARALGSASSSTRAAAMAVRWLGTTQASLPTALLLKHDGSVTRASFSPDRTRVLTASQDNTARLWDAQSGKALGEPMRHENSVNNAAFSPDGRRVVTRSGSTARLWDAQTGQPLGEPMRHEYFIIGVGFSPDGALVVTVSQDNTARLWDAQSGKALGEPMRHENSVNNAAFSPDGRRVVTRSGSTARLWDAQTSQPLGEPMRHENWVDDAAFSPDGARVVTRGGRNARLWDAQTGQPLGEPMRHENEVNDAVFSPDGVRVLTASKDKTARLWDALSGKPLGEPMRHESEVYYAFFSPESARIVTGSVNKTALLWNAQSGKLLGEPISRGVTLLRVDFLSDGLHVIAVDDDVVSIWTVAAGSATRAWEILPPDADSPPAWFATFLRWHGKARMNQNGAFRYETSKERLDTQKELFDALATIAAIDKSFYVQFVRRFLPAEEVAARGKADGAPVETGGMPPPGR